MMNHGKHGARHVGVEAAVREDAQGRQVQYVAERTEVFHKSLRLAGWRWYDDGDMSRPMKDAVASASVLYAAD